MKKYFARIAVLSLVWGLFACGYREGVENTDRRAYLYFTGYTRQVEVVVDDFPFDVGQQMTVNDRYQIQPGEHLVEVKHDGRTLVRRQIQVADGAAREIQVPNP